jgi:V/A-type H+-transporting ATPase subunit B
VPDLTGYITEGQLLLSRDFHTRSIYPPLDPLPSLSRLMKDGIGSNRTRDDHAHLASQIYAAYATARQARELATVIGEGELSELDTSYLQFGEAFETLFIAQGLEEERSIVESLDRGWRLLDRLPESELTRVSVDEVRRYGQRAR